MLKLGEIFENRYRIRSCLGEDSSGIAYLAFNIMTEHHLTIKEIQKSGDAFMDARILQAARIAGSFQHPGIATLLDLIEREDRYYLIQGYSIGEPLNEYLSSTKPDMPELERYAWELADILGYIHAKDALYLDLQPKNILRKQDGTLMLTDIQSVIARKHAETHAGIQTGIVQFAAPEQFVSGSTLDERADIYALGAMLFYMAAGKTMVDVRFANPNIGDYRKDLQGSVLERLIHRCLETNPAARYGSCSEILAELGTGVKEKKKVMEESPVRKEEISSGRKTQVFISFKHDDENKNPTVDYEMAKQLHERLEKENINTFFSDVHAKGVSGGEFLRAIIGALEEASVLVQVGSSNENLDSEWVYFEFETFFQLLANNRKDKENSAILLYLTPEFDVGNRTTHLIRYTFEQDIERLVGDIKQVLNKEQSVRVLDENTQVLYRRSPLANMKSGEVLDNRWLLTNRLKKGEHSILFEAYDLHVETKKVIRIRDNRHPEEAENELQCLRSLRSLPGVPNVIDVFTHPTYSYFVEDFIEGISLEKLNQIMEYELPEDKIVRMAEKTFEILEDMHKGKEPVIHCNIKPANIRTDGRSVILINYAGARILSPGKTASAVIRLTPKYDSVSQYGNLGNVGRTADIHAMGMVLFELVCADPHQEFETRALEEAEVQDGLKYIIMRCLDHAGDQQYTSCRAVLRNLHRISSLHDKYAEMLASMKKKEELLRPFEDLPVRNYSRSYADMTVILSNPGIEREG